jgi:hypothetical protein
MAYLRNWWRRGAIHRYFAELEPIDRATALIVLGLLIAWIVAFTAIVRARDPGAGADTRLTAPPFTMDFAEARRGVSA